jgi:hypothetical protein
MTKHKRYGTEHNENTASDPSMSDAPTVAEMQSLLEGMRQNTADIVELQKQLAELKGAVGSLSGSVAATVPDRPQGAGDPMPVLVPTPTPGLPDEPKPDFQDPTAPVPAEPEAPKEPEPAPVDASDVTLDSGESLTVSAK